MLSQSNDWLIRNRIWKSCWHFALTRNLGCPVMGNIRTSETKWRREPPLTRVKILGKRGGRLARCLHRKVFCWINVKQHRCGPIFAIFLGILPMHSYADEVVSCAAQETANVNGNGRLDFYVVSIESVAHGFKDVFCPTLEKDDR